MSYNTDSGNSFSLYFITFFWSVSQQDFLFPEAMTLEMVKKMKLKFWTWVYLEVWPFCFVAGL